MFFFFNCSTHGTPGNNKFCEQTANENSERFHDSRYEISRKITAMSSGEPACGFHIPGVSLKSQRQRNELETRCDCESVERVGTHKNGDIGVSRFHQCGVRGFAIRLESVSRRTGRGCGTRGPNSVGCHGDGRSFLLFFWNQVVFECDRRGRGPLPEINSDFPSNVSGEDFDGTRPPSPQKKPTFFRNRGSLYFVGDSLRSTQRRATDVTRIVIERFEVDGGQRRSLLFGRRQPRPRRRRAHHGGAESRSCRPERLGQLSDGVKNRSSWKSTLFRFFSSK